MLFRIMLTSRRLRRGDVTRAISVEDIIAEAASLPLRDAAYTIWREKAHFERLERQTRRLSPLESGKRCSWLSAGAVCHLARVRATR